MCIMFIHVAYAFYFYHIHIHIKRHDKAEVVIARASAAHLLVYPGLRTSGCAVAESYIFNMLTVLATVSSTPTQKPQ